MLFSSLVFLWLFLPAVFLVYRILPHKGQNLLLLLASLLFYGWGEPRYLFLMLFSITANWIGGLWIDRCTEKKRRVALIAVLTVNLGLLAYFKYYSFAADTLAALFGGQILPLKQIALPIGISFYTFQAMSYCIDLYRGSIQVQKSWLHLALYISFFPQLIAGPIVQYPVVERQLAERTLDVQGTAYGAKRFIYGLAKKVIIANAMAVRADEIYGLAPGQVSTGLAWLGALFYTLQLYYDFSGYSDMAIGLGRMFGFHFPENFDYPYISSSITELWRRWHMSLSGWFREYLYIPLGGSRKGRKRQVFNLLVVFLATGLWHGASWQFVAWGLWHGVMIVLEKLFLLNWLERCPRWVARVYTMLNFVLSVVIFRAPGLHAGIGWLRAMLLPAAGSGAYPCMRYLDGRTVLLALVGIALCGPIQTMLPRLKKELFKEEAPGALQAVTLLVLLFLCVMLLVSGTYNPFIYFRF